MKFASFNVWDSDAGMPHRRGQVAAVLSALAADVLCLQEVQGDFAFLSALPKLPFSARHEDSGLITLSRYPIKEQRCMPYALMITIACGRDTVCTVNVHLPWQSALLREQAIVSIVEAGSALHADYIFLAGDFNCSDTSAVHRFLCGEQSLSGHDAYFFDLAEAYAEQTGIPAAPTLDFRKNPRWGIVDPPNTFEKNQRFDRILLANPNPARMPVLREFGQFGHEISEVTHLAPSDHFGVYACLDF